MIVTDELLEAFKNNGWKEKTDFPQFFHRFLKQIDTVLWMVDIWTAPQALEKGEGFLIQARIEEDHGCVVPLYTIAQGVKFLPLDIEDHFVSLLQRRVKDGNLSFVTSTLVANYLDHAENY